MGRRLWMVPLAIAVGAVVLATPLVLGQLQLDHTTRLVPSLSHALTALAIAGMFAPIIQIALLTTVLRRPVRERRLRFRVVYCAGVIVAQLVVAVAILGGTLVSDPHFLDGGMVSSTASPDGARTAYVYTTFMCGVAVYVDAGGYKMREVTRQSATCDNANIARAAWKGDDVTIVGADGTPLPTDSWGGAFVVH